MSDSTLQARIDQAHRHLSTLKATLDSLGFKFDEPERAFPGVEDGALASIARIEHHVGQVPLALKLFWTCIGSVNFNGQHPDWIGCRYPDPLTIYPPSVAVDELDEYLADFGEATKHGCTYVIPISPDALHKANVSGGMWYNVDVPALANDPPLNDAPRKMSFLEYLESAISAGGFPGLIGEANHSWPLSRLRLVT